MTIENVTRTESIFGADSNCICALQLVRSLLSFALLAMKMTRAQALALLRLDEGASDADINKAFRKLALRHHPDKVGDDGEYASAFGLDDLLTAANDDGCVRAGVPMMMKKMK